MAEGSITTEEYMEKLERFVAGRTLGRDPHGQSEPRVRQFFDAAAAFYQKESTQKKEKQPEGGLNGPANRFIVIKTCIKGDWIMKLEEMKITELFDTSHTIAAKLFEGKTYPWEVLEDIGSFIEELGPHPASERVPQGRKEHLDPPHRPSGSHHCHGRTGHYLRPRGCAPERLYPGQSDRRRGEP